MTLPPNKPRSRRLRKKLHVDEFKEYGFDYEVHLNADLTPEQECTLFDRFIDEVIDARDLALGGGLSGGFVCYFERRSATDEDRTAVGEWLRANLPAESVSVGELRDVWYSTKKPA